MREEGSDCAGPSTTENHLQNIRAVGAYVHILDCSTQKCKRTETTKSPLTGNDQRWKPPTYLLVRDLCHKYILYCIVLYCA